MNISDKGNDADFERSPYISSERYTTPKEDFKTIGKRLAEIFSSDSKLDMVDIGCANGELLYFLHQQFPEWRMTGYDRNSCFLDTGRAFPGLHGVELRQEDFYNIEGAFDLVVTTCFLSLFPDIKVPIEKLLSLCRKGGYLFATGLFNPYDVDVRVQYLDHTAPGEDKVWRTDSNRHSQRAIREWLESQTEWIEFQECIYDIDLKPDPQNPIRVWTFRNADGNSSLINGAGQIANQTLMVIKKI